MPYPRAKITALGRYWEPVVPCGDNDDLSARSERLMMRLSAHEDPEFFVAPRGSLYAGWVIGVTMGSRQAAPPAPKGEMVEATVSAKFEIHHYDLHCEQEFMRKGLAAFLEGCVGKPVVVEIAAK